MPRVHRRTRIRARLSRKP